MFGLFLITPGSTAKAAKTAISEVNHPVSSGGQQWPASETRIILVKCANLLCYRLRRHKIISGLHYQRGMV